MDPHVGDVAAMTDGRGFFDVDVKSMPVGRRYFPAQPRTITEGHDQICCQTRSDDGPVRARLLHSKSGIIRCSICFPGPSLVRLARGQLMAGWCVVSHGMRDTHTSRVMSREGVWNDGKR